MSQQNEMPERLSIVQLSLLTGIDRRTVSSKLTEARVPFEPGAHKSKLYRPSEALPQLYKNRDEPERDQNASQLDEEKLLLQRAKREKAELDLAERRREVIPLAEITAAVSREYTFVRSQLRGLPSRLAKHLSVMTAPEECFELLSNAIDEVLSELQADAIESLASTAQQPDPTEPT